jgi:uncharacterized protein (TIGR02453 family)
MAFKGWPAEALEFYEGLEADNSRSYWLAHKQTYDEKVHAPMVALLAELEPDYGTGKIFRPHRDVRFSKDKSPYKTAIAATVERGGYVQLSARGLAAGAGMYSMEPDQLDRYRHAVADDRSGAELEQLIKEVTPHGIDVTGHERLRSAPRGYPKDHPRIELLRNKGLVAWQEWPVAAWLGTARAKDRIVTFIQLTRPLSDWLRANVGPSQRDPQSGHR